jgi:predicted metal-binding membrane protein
MWLVMMVAMMMPVLFPMLRRCRQSIGQIPRLNLLTLVISIGYFFTWLLVGIVVFPMGIWLADLAMQNSTIAGNAPKITGLIIIIAGILQFTRWKAKQLACCRNIPEQHIPIKRNISSSLRYGFRIGLRCNYCCAGLTLVLLVVGVMDPVAMALVAIAIAAERLAPAGEHVAKLIGIVLVGIGLYMLIHALGF